MVWVFSPKTLNVCSHFSAIFGRFEGGGCVEIEGSPYSCSTFEFRSECVEYLYCMDRARPPLGHRRHEGLILPLLQEQRSCTTKRGQSWIS
jgi:hypothetical protein